MNLIEFADRFVRRTKLLSRAMIARLPASTSRHLLYFWNYRRILRLQDPKLFNEKVNWRIVYDRRPVLKTISSKYWSKQYARRIAPDLAVPKTLWYGQDLAQLATMSLHGGWVLKVDHRSGSVLFGEGSPDVDALVKEAGNWLKRDGLSSGLWAYTELDPAYILEERLGDAETVPADYKFFVFDGSVRLIQVDRSRFSRPVRNLYSASWEPIPYTYTWPVGPPMSAPPSLDRMIDVASRLGAGLDFVRVDLFDVAGEVFFGEMTAYPAAGLSHWPRSLDQLVGEYWSLPELGNVRA